MSGPCRSGREKGILLDFRKPSPHCICAAGAVAAAPGRICRLAAESGGSGTFVYLAVIPGRGAGSQAATAALVGDRVRVTSLAVTGDAIHIVLLEFAPGDPMCCPSRHGERRWGYRHGALIEYAAD